MKTFKLILIAFTIILAGALVHDAYSAPVDSLQTESIPTLEEIPGQMYNDVKSALKELADGLDTTVDYVWPILVHQQYISGVSDIIITAIVVLATLCAFAFGSKHVNFEADPTPLGILMTFLMVAGVICSIAFSLSALPDGIKHLLNPEYYALMEVLRLLN